MNTEIKSKVCTKCKEEKALEEFGRRKRSRDGRMYQCKACDKAYYEANREAKLAQKKAYYEANKEELLAKNKAWLEANKEERLAQQRAYYEANKEQVLAKQKAYRQANREKEAARKNEYQKKRYTEDPVFRTMRALRNQTSRLGDCKNKTTIEIVGISAEEFWRRNGSPTEEQLEDLHIDHIVPLSWFDLSNEDHVAVSSHHSNLQYLNTEDNLTKGSSYAGTPDNIIAYKDDFDIEAYVKDMLPLINIL